MLYRSSSGLAVVDIKILELYIHLFQKTLSEEKQKAFISRAATGPMGVFRPLKYVPENSIERLPVSESISKSWTTLTTAVVRGYRSYGSFSATQVCP